MWKNEVKPLCSSNKLSLSLNHVAAFTKLSKKWCVYPPENKFWFLPSSPIYLKPTQMKDHSIFPWFNAHFSLERTSGWQRTERSLISAVFRPLKHHVMLQYHVTRSFWVRNYDTYCVCKVLFRCCQKLTLLAVVLSIRVRRLLSLET